MTLTVLGCSGTYAPPGGACSGYLVQGAGTTVWVDCGAGALANLQRHVPFEALDAVVVSHSHPDHWVELPILRNVWRYALGREGLAVYTTAQVRDFVEQVSGPGGSGATFAWSIVTGGDRVTIGGLAFTFAVTDHPVETLAMRVDGDGRSLAYSADTGPGWSLEALGPGLHLALCEATFLHGEQGDSPHLSARQAGAMAAAAGAERLMVTHAWPTSDPRRHRDEAAAAFGGPTLLATVNERTPV